jgi:RND family efflux transporter MFP subunit
MLLAPATAQDAATAVVVERVVEREVSEARRVVGTVTPLRSSTIGSAVDGRVVEFLVKSGDPVRSGQALARLRTETLRIELAAARAELGLYEQQLAELHNGSRPEEIAEARARMLGARAAMENAIAKLARIEELAATRATSQAELGDAREQAELARNMYAAAEAQWQRIESGPRAEQIAQAQAQVELQHQRVRLIEDRIEKHTVVAPFHGFVAAEFTEVGEWIQQGDPVVQVIQLDQVEIETPVPAEYAVQLQPGEIVRVEFPELPERLLTGGVARLVPLGAAAARTFPLYIRMENPLQDGKPLLMAGMLARVALPGGRRQVTPLVPKDALVLDGGKQYVFVFQPDPVPAELANRHRADTGTVRQVPVTLGVAAGGLIQVRGPIRAGQAVVVLGNERLQDGQRVTLQRVETKDLR